MPLRTKSWLTAGAAGAMATATLAVSIGASSHAVLAAPTPASPTTPIQHVVVIFQENVSFDHYFATYPHATNTDGTPFTAAPGTPAVNGLSGALLTNNPNSANPQRLGAAQALTCDMDHEYTDEQKAFNAGKMDKFVEYTANTSPSTAYRTCGSSLVMDYYDGNTTTGLWNYAQHYAMSDNSYGTTFGPSTPGALNLISGQTHGIGTTATPGTSSLTGEVENGTVIGDPQPLGDDCSTRDQVQMTGKNVGDELNAKHVSWGFFEGGFRPSVAYDPTTGAPAQCGNKHAVGTALGYTGQAGFKGDYIPHHEPFQYYASTANPHHLPPSSTDKIGHADQANHQYDITDFWAAANSGNMPAVSFLKAPGYQDGHAGYSDPADEQAFLVDTINKLQALPAWSNTAVVVSYDDSDGWYDHAFQAPVSPSAAPADALNGPGQCGTTPPAPDAYQDRCGYGPRLPLLVISPWAKANAVDHTVTDQSSILRFIEDNWSLGRIGDQSFDAKAGPLTNMFDFSGTGSNPPLTLDPVTGQPTT